MFLLIGTTKKVIERPCMHCWQLADVRKRKKEIKSEEINKLAKEKKQTFKFDVQISLRNQSIANNTRRM